MGNTEHFASMEYFTEKHSGWIDALNVHFPHVLKSGQIEAKELATLRTLSNQEGFTNPSFFQTDQTLKVSRGVYTVPDLDNISRYLFGTPIEETEYIEDTVDDENYVCNFHISPEQKIHVPKKDDRFQNTTISRKLKKVLKGGRFFPIYMSGNTGVGKTTIINQVCAQLDRGCVRANITGETDELDLIGGYSLIDGNTIYENGPVVEAMITGSILLLDEIDLGSPKLMCLQPVLEGKGIYIKKTGKWVHPAEGFNVIATANTKGKGSDTGHFVGAQYLNDALMDRFSYWMDVPYPSNKEETEILKSFWASVSSDPAPEKFIGTLIRWATEIRQAFEKDNCPDTISTRRLIDTLAHKNIFNASDQNTVKEMIVRFDGESQHAFLDFWKMVDVAENESTDYKNLRSKDGTIGWTHPDHVTTS